MSSGIWHSSDVEAAPPLDLQQTVTDRRRGLPFRVEQERRELRLLEPVDLRHLGRPVIVDEWTEQGIERQQRMRGVWLETDRIVEV